MDYFWLKQDQRYLHTPEINDFYQKMRRKDFAMETAFKIPEKIVMYCNAGSEQEFIDILDRQVFLISKAVMHVFHMYERGLTYKFFCLINNISGAYGAYYAPIIPEYDCMVNRIWRPGEVLSIRQNLIPGSAVFRVKYDFKDIVAVRLDIAESLLRRNLRGIELMKLHLC